MDDEITVRVKSLARSLMEKRMPPEQQHRATASIHRLSRVPMHLRVNNPKDYTPRFAAIGPFHADQVDGRLRAAERLKVAYLKSLVSRGHPDRAQHLAVIEEYIRVVAAREKEARSMYVGEEVADITCDDFIQMMVLDGCFIIEHLVNVAIGRDEPSLHATPFGPSQLSVDLILAENQMPFFILVDMIACSKLPELDGCGYTPSVLLVKLVLYYLAGEKGRDLSEELPAADGVAHILHLLHAMITTARIHWQPPPPPSVLEGGWVQEAMQMLPRLPSIFGMVLLRWIVPKRARRRAGYDYVPSASDMKRMGVQLKKARGGPGKSVVGIASVMGSVPLAVTANDKNNQLQLPQLRLEFGTAPLLLNLMAFEQSSFRVQHDVSAYVAFMAKLVRSAEDARVLAEARVVQQLGNESMEDVASFFRVVGAASGSGEAIHMLFGTYLFMTLNLLMEWSRGWVDVERNYFTFLAELLALVTFVSGVATIFQTYAAFKYH